MRVKDLPKEYFITEEEYFLNKLKVYSDSLDTYIFQYTEKFNALSPAFSRLKDLNQDVIKKDNLADSVLQSSSYLASKISALKKTREVLHMLFPQIKEYSSNFKCYSENGEYLTEQEMNNITPENNLEKEIKKKKLK